jgi:glycosyltransferase involved in cell wall biosynthesis
VSAAPRSPRIAVYDLHWQTIGGGEQVAGAVVEALVAAGHEVTMLGPEPVDPPFLLERLGVDVSGAAFRVVDAELGAAAASADYEAFINVTYRSTAPNHAEHGLYYVHFPEPPRSSAGALGDLAGRFTIGAVDRTPLRKVRPVAVARDEVALRTRQHGYVATYDCFAGNSRFTNGWIERLWGVTPELLYPPVQPVAPFVPELLPGSARRSTIVSVGRFFDARHGHGKKQLELVEAFRSLVRSGRADGWELTLIGGCDAANRDYLLEVRRAAIGLPVSVLANAPGALRQEVVGSASIYWHAAGFGEDPERHPERFEHFGIAIVEAMSAGVVPVVFDAAGPAEIVEDGVSGRRWTTIDELVEMTAELIADSGITTRLSAAAVRRSMHFSKNAFAERLLAIVGAWWV